MERHAVLDIVGATVGDSTTASTTSISPATSPAVPPIYEQIINEVFNHFSMIHSLSGILVMRSIVHVILLAQDHAVERT